MQAFFWPSCRGRNRLIETRVASDRAGDNPFPQNFLTVVFLSVRTDFRASLPTPDLENGKGAW